MPLFYLGRKCITLHMWFKFQMRTFQISQPLIEDVENESNTLSMNIYVKLVK